MKKYIKLSPRAASALKYLCAFLLLAVMVRKVGLEEITMHLKELSLGEGFVVLALATAAQVICAMRMRFFFNASGFEMGKYYAIVLYYVGTFYNFLLPGGVGGDAYKVVLVRRRMEIPAIRGIHIMLADRASGLCIVLLTMYGGLYLMGFAAVPYGRLMLILATITTPYAYVVASRKLLRQNAADMVSSLQYSLVSQMMWVAIVVVLTKAIGHGGHIIAYITLYCAAAIASMIPVSVGGLGLREMTYFYGAGIIHRMVGQEVDPNLGMAISLSMFMLMFISSLPGLFWLNKVGVLTIKASERDKSWEGSYASVRDTRGEDWN